MQQLLWSEAADIGPGQHKFFHLSMLEMQGQGPYQQKGRDVGVDGPQHRDQQRGADFSACHELPDADGDCRGQQDERHAVQPNVSGRAVLQSALSLGCSLEGLHTNKGSAQ